MVASTLPRVQYYPCATRLNDTGGAAYAHVFFGGYQVTAPIVATGRTDAGDYDPRSLYGPLLQRDELFTVDHNALGNPHPEDCWRHIAHQISENGEARRLIVSGLSLGGQLAAAFARFLQEECEYLFPQVALLLISAPGKLTDLQLTQRLLLKLVDSHPASVGRLAHWAAIQAPQLFLDSRVRRELSHMPLTKVEVLDSIKESSDWLLEAVHALVSMNGFGPEFRGHGPVMTANLPQACEKVVLVDRAVRSAQETYGNIGELVFQAPYHGVPWLHPEPYWQLFVQQVLPYINRYYT